MIKFKVLEVNMKIKNIDLKNVGNISDLSLSFNENVNVICGTNGIGKTTILRAITALFTNENLELKKKYGTVEGTVSAKMYNDKIRNLNIISVDPNKSNDSYDGTQDDKLFLMEGHKVLNIFDNRSIEYMELNSVQRYPKKEELLYSISRLAKTNTTSTTLKNWLVNRVMAYQGDKEHLTDSEKFNIEKMLVTFSVIDKKINLKNINYKTFEVILEDHGNEVFLEFESTGFKNILFIILGIIEQIEFRFDNLKITDFDGIVLIDEVESHLHPSWQNKIIDILKEMFPKVQFIITTHSPSVLQNLDKDEIIPLYTEGNDVKIKELELSEYGLKGWTLEEILSNVMGVNDLKNELLQESLESFSEALDDRNDEIAKLEYSKLNKMLHAENPLRQIIEIQKAGLF